jgi:hypothetical protein
MQNRMFKDCLIFDFELLRMQTSQSGLSFYILLDNPSSTSHDAESSSLLTHRFYFQEALGKKHHGLARKVILGGEFILVRDIRLPGTSDIMLIISSNDH